MPRYTITNFGRGLDTTRNPSLLQPGFAQSSINLLHNFGEDRVKLRGGFARVMQTVGPLDGEKQNLYEFIKNDGTTKKLFSSGTALYSFTNTFSSGLTSVGSLAASTSDRFETYLNWCLITNNGSGNYITDGTSSHFYPLDTTAPTGTINSTLGGPGNLSVGAYVYGFARYSSITGEISPAYQSALSVTTVAGSQQNTMTPAVAFAVVQQFDQFKIYRTKVNTVGPFFLVDTITVAAFNAGWLDNIADSSLTVLSTIHDANGAVDTSVVENAVDVFQHRGRAFFVGLTGHPSRIRWTQLFAFETDSTTDARHDLEPDDGDTAVRGISYNGIAVFFKQHSIHILVGDVDQTGFVWQVVSDKTTGIGAYFPYTAVPTPIGICFCGERGIYSYHPQTGINRISTNIQAHIDSWNFARKNDFRATYDEATRAYLLVYKVADTNFYTRMLAYYIDTGFWSEWIVASDNDTSNNNLTPSSFAQMHDPNGLLTTYATDNQSTLIRYDSTKQADYSFNGSIYSGTITSISGTNHVIDSGASFPTAGDGLTGDFIIIVNTAGAFSLSSIVSNTSTNITTGTFSVVVPTVGYKYYVGSLTGLLSLGFSDMGEAGYKRITRISFMFQRQTHSVNLIVGFTIDNDTAPTTTFVTLQNTGFSITIPVNRVAQRIAPYIKTIGNANPFELLKIEVDYLVLPARLPMNR